jgi:hypothetical protein
MRIEVLEDRATPAVINFVPFSAVADHQLPALTTALPSTALLQFNPLPDVVALAKADTTIQTPVHIFGSFQQILSSPMANPLNISPLKLVVSYQINGDVTGASVAPTTTNPVGSLTAHIDLTGKYTAALYVPSPTTPFRPPWVITGTFTEKGDVSGSLNLPSATATDEISFTATIASTQTEWRLSPTATVPILWSVQSTVQAAGKFEESTILPPPPTPLSPVVVTSPFSLQDHIDSSLAPILSNGTLGPAVNVSAVDNAAGTATLYVFPNATPPPPIVLGTTRYLQQLSEELTYPDGSKVDLGQVFATDGLFVNASIGPIVTPLHGGLAGNPSSSYAVAATD